MAFRSNIVSYTFLLAEDTVRYSVEEVLQQQFQNGMVVRSLLYANPGCYSLSFVWPQTSGFIGEEIFSQIPGRNYFIQYPNWVDGKGMERYRFTVLLGSFSLGTAFRKESFFILYTSSSDHALAAAYLFWYLDIA